MSGMNKVFRPGFDDRHAVINTSGDLDSGSNGCKPDGIPNDIIDRAPQQRTIELRHQPPIARDRELEAGFAGERFVEFPKRREFVCDVDHLTLDAGLRTFRTREKQQALDHLREATARVDVGRQHIAVLVGSPSLAKRHFIGNQDRVSHRFRT